MRKSCEWAIVVAPKWRILTGMAESLMRAVRKRIIPPPLRGKPFRRLQREFYQRRYRYPTRNLLAIGQQKSGSTWLERMLCDVPGYMRWKPNNIKFGKADLRLEDLVPPPAGYTVTKVHTPPTPENLRVVHAIGRPYVVLIRDLRDICVSWSYYVRITPDHPRHAETKDLPVERVIDYFIRERLEDYVRWQIEWRRNLHPVLGVLVRYEDMLADTHAVMRLVYAHYGLSLSDELLGRIVAKNSFRSVTGRAPGQADATSFNRKGVSGDWRNHLSEAQKAAFKAVGQEALIAGGYETSGNW